MSVVSAGNGFTLVLPEYILLVIIVNAKTGVSSMRTAESFIGCMF